MKQRDWQGILLRIAVVLGGLLVLLTGTALLYIAFQVFLRFGSVVALFILGAIIAYVLNPAVSWVAARTGKRWVGTLVVYVGAAAGLALLAMLIVQPLVTESSSLVRALHNPAAGSLQALSRMADQSRAVGSEMRAQRVLVRKGREPSPLQIQRVRAGIAGIQNEILAIGGASGNTGARPPAAGRRMTPETQIRVPPTYLAPLQHSTAALVSDYEEAIRQTPAAIPALTRSVSDADRVTSRARALRTTLSSTPILLLDAQTWVDQHHIDINVAQSTGQAVKQIQSQLSGILNNTAGILSQTASWLLDLFLVLLISVYFVSDGARMVRGAIELVPSAYHRQATFFVTSVDSMLGGYIRAQILLALLAGVLGGIGAAVLGVPFALVIGVSTFFLQLLPVIGPMLVYIAPMVISLLFTSMPTPVLLLVYLIVMEQVVTNIIGPRVNSKSVGIHPLEAMAAALVGYPIGGVLGSFLAVPTVGLIHVLVKEAYTSWRPANVSLDVASVSGTSAHESARPTGSSPNCKAERGASPEHSR